MNLTCYHGSDKQEEKLYSDNEKISYRKTNITERLEYIKAYAKLKQQEDFIEKITNCFITNMKIESELFQNITYNQLEVTKRRYKYLDTLRATTSGIFNELKSAKTLIYHPYGVQKIDINDYKQRLCKVSKMIHEFQKLSPLQSLVQEQTQLESELSEFESTLHHQKSRNNTPTLPSTTKTSVHKTNSDKICRGHEGVADFNHLIVRTGHTQGWSDEDHSLFLNLRKKCNTVPALVIAIQNKCPDLSNESIVNHEAWYKIYLELREKQKNAIKEWRKQKKTGSERAEQNETVALENTIQNRIGYGASESNSAAKTSRAILKSSGVDEMKAAEKKEMIKKWRLEKEEKSLMENEQKKHLELRKIMEATGRKSGLDKIKPLILEYREQRLKQMIDSKSNANLQSTGENSRKYESVRMIRLFRQQDDKFMMKRQSHIMNMRKENQNIKMKGVPRKVIKPRECSTLLAPTKVWELRCKSNPTTEETSHKVRAATHWRNQETM